MTTNVLKAVCIGNYSYAPDEFEIFARAKASRFGLQGAEADSFCRELHEEKEASGNLYRALVELGTKLALHPLGTVTQRDGFGHAYALVPTAQEGVAALVMIFGSGADEMRCFDDIEGQSADDLQQYAEAVAAVSNALTLRTEPLPPAQFEVLTDETPEPEELVAL
ncbi:hypothetical protein QU481_16610 [Crenobacter sp. SG2303]|uniref:Uncharacterized protein n=1 Tax=Crenobacter oryzisoli TaxID=3056844 RepID=A0ABT7XRR5_9NEIS|nr:MULTISPECIES: hypothetical protein [unclassified Crenobacter]MDN0076491.1 hypothetical protein [Crenobacter sp. SG2303]MDN0083258.1 hypothetical protein [Crenobacter sp. SG2305]